jgi:hypothetical protein
MQARRYVTARARRVIRSAVDWAVTGWRALDPVEIPIVLSGETDEG